MIDDLIIIGAGPGGLTAALYAVRSELKIVVIEKLPLSGGTAVNATVVENWPGTQTISGAEFGIKITEHAKKAGADIKTFTEVLSVDFSGDIKKIKTNNGEFKAKAVIIATGATHAKLGVPGEESLKGAGVSYCASCDGPFFKDKIIAVIGGGNSALTQALYLANIGKEVLLIHRRDAFRAEKAVVDKVNSEKKIKLVLSHIISEIIGEEKVTAIKVKDVLSGNEKNMPVDAVFIYSGISPNTSLFSQYIKMDELGFILTDENMATNVRGVFAVGDARATPFRQIVTAASDGAIAAMAAGRYIREKS